MAIEKEEATTFPVLGVDVSKGRLDAALLKESGEQAGRGFVNDPGGQRALLEWAGRSCDTQRPTLCVESSGGYELDLCEQAHRQGNRVLLVCALRTASFRKSLHLRNKTDIDDARLLCRFALHMRLRAWTPPAPKVRQLKELVLIRDHAVKEAAKHRVLIGTMRTAAGRRNARRTAKALEREADKVTAEVGRLLDAPEFSETGRLLRTIPGIGPTTAAAVCAVGDLGRFGDVRQFAAFAGIHPGRRQSGAALERARVCKAGDRSLRSAMFMAALSASVHNPAVRAFARQLRARRPDLRNKQIICACAHKLLRIIFGVIRNRQPFAHGSGGQSEPAPKIRACRPGDRSANAAPIRKPQPAGKIARQVLEQLRAKIDPQRHVAPTGGNVFDGC